MITHHLVNKLALSVFIKTYGFAFLLPLFSGCLEVCYIAQKKRIGSRVKRRDSGFWQSGQKNIFRNLSWIYVKSGQILNFRPIFSFCSGPKPFMAYLPSRGTTFALFTTHGVEARRKNYLFFPKPYRKIAETCRVSHTWKMKEWITQISKQPLTSWIHLIHSDSLCVIGIPIYLLN